MPSKETLSLLSLCWLCSYSHSPGCHPPLLCRQHTLPVRARFAVPHDLGSRAAPQPLSPRPALLQGVPTHRTLCLASLSLVRFLLPRCSSPGPSTAWCTLLPRVWCHTQTSLGRSDETYPKTGRESQEHGKKGKYRLCCNCHQYY